MARIVVLGAGMCGLAAGILLRRDGHDVTVLERDFGGVPPSADEAWEQWPRHGVSQFHQPHFLQPRARQVLEAELPDVVRGLEAAGAAKFNLLAFMPPQIQDRSPRHGDEQFTTLTARRPVIEQVLARAAEVERGLQLRRGVGVLGVLSTRQNGIPHVGGVLTESGDRLSADLVVDAMGRRSPLPRWLETAGSAPVREEVEDSGFIYYTRFFRSHDGTMPGFSAPLLTALGTFSLLVIPGDNATWSVTVVISAGDRPLKRLRDPEAWTAVVRSCPHHAQWLEGEPITDVLAMGGVVDRYRRFALGNRPIATGIAAVGDAWACSNPSLGRGISFGLVHVQRLRDVVREHLDDPRQFAEAWDAVTEAELTPWYRETVEEDRARFAEIEALRNGRESGQNLTAAALRQRTLVAAVARDPDVFRTYLASRSCLAPLRGAYADPGFVDRITELARDAGPAPLLGPDRAQLLSLLDRVPAAA
jgi:2-polyprenyl-6-methoxyphenol hydroxylase-like FAD-dependent oxidoreductase